MKYVEKKLTYFWHASVYVKNNKICSSFSRLSISCIHTRD